ncbi:hypothetical protein M427DRAFT_194253 [Gonapodya prolifera JEL478]|uniref:RRM domain-containing protein n=1 Tax=Gonapodya prolifera (strain JEL478) TaxID=1344416 RepID=A0A139APY2_GONPJ|nr:hypothetical protein M427DRAFT_194253 [Gonapodya prolifera JEL478]|eukprot:KXS18545.1 hypothetical protein M427DRAFT_194253 [Gonapodya prolifera JEL478]
MTAENGIEKVEADKVEAATGATDEKKELRDNSGREGGDAGKSDDGRTSLHIKGITDAVRREDLLKVFEKYGRVRDVYIPKDYYTGKNRGFAYVQYASHS